MCGIAGLLSFGQPPGMRAVETMCAALAHRGPDAGHVIDLGMLVVGHRRLSVIDPTAASDQPMSDPTGRCWLSYNGELYNYRELRRELMERGMRFRTAGDTEVVLLALQCWGEAAIERFEGMFALAFWDSDARTLILARDRAGEKPLFYMPLGDGGLAFASESRALLACHPGRATVDPVGLGQMLAIGYTVGTRTLCRDVVRLAPGCSLTCSPDRGTRLHRYWDPLPDFRQKRRFASPAAAADELRALIDDAVQRQLVSDVPLGAFLSGGIDSSTIVAAMANALPAERVRTFTMGFGEPGFDEVAEASAAADHIGVAHDDRVVRPDRAGLLAALTTAAKEPLADTSAIPMLALAGLAREHVTVCLSGDGGDELFAGYETYAADRLHRRLGPLIGWLGAASAGAIERLWPASFGKVALDYKLRQFLSGLALDPVAAHHHWRVIAERQLRTALLRPEHRSQIAGEDGFEVFRGFADEARDLHPLDQALYVDFKTWLPDDVLTKVDRMTMARSLESRAPFLDRRLIAFAASLPVAYKLRGWTKKWLLKQSQASRLPQTLIHRRKAGFNAPVSRWFAATLKDNLRDALQRPLMSEWFDHSAMMHLFDQHQQGKRDRGFTLLALFQISLWLEGVFGAP